MHGYNSYNNYARQLKHYFISGLSKVIDIGNLNQIEYPGCMTDAEASAFDKNALTEDFITLGKDIGKAINSYGRTHKI